MNHLLIELAVKSTIAGAVGLIAYAAMRRGSAASRHFVLMATLAGLLILPVASFVVPRWSVPLVTVAPVSTTTNLAYGSDSFKLPAVSNLQAAGVGSKRLTTQNYTLRGRAESKGVSSTSAILMVWAIVTGVLTFRFVLRLLRLRLMERRLPMATDPALCAFVAEHFRRSGRHVLLLEGDANDAPMTWGHARPILMLPQTASTWPSERLQSVVLHELAHIERSDWIASVIAHLACTINWFNPLAWIILDRLVQESESAADDRVLVKGLSRFQYASHLLEVLKELRRSDSASGAALAMAGRSPLESRLRAILEERKCRKPIQGFAAITILFALGGLLLAIATAGPTVVASTQAALVAKTVIVTPSKSSSVASLLINRNNYSSVRSLARRWTHRWTRSHQSVTRITHSRPVTTSFPKVPIPPTPPSHMSVHPVTSPELTSQEFSNMDIKNAVAEATKGIGEGFKEMDAEVNKSQLDVDQSLRIATRDLEKIKDPDERRIAVQAMKSGMKAYQIGITAIKPSITAVVKLALEKSLPKKWQITPPNVSDIKN